MAEPVAVERRLGRPKAEGSEALHNHILDTAIRLFTERGYAGTSIEQVAAAAGAGKQTIYRRYPSKEDLFKAVVAELCRNLITSVEEFEREESDPLVALRSACFWLLEMSVRPEVVDTYRILIAEASRFPALVEYAVSMGNHPLEEAITRLVAAAAEAGQIDDGGESVLVTDALMGLVTGTALRRALMNDQSPAGEETIRAHFETAWTIFLRGVAPHAPRLG